MSVPFYSFPRARFVEMIEPAAIGIRTLSDHQLQSERDELAVICGVPDRHLADVLTLRIYEAEVARRANPALQFDDALDLALQRLESLTNEADRAFVSDVGRKLYSIGGRAALEAARERMIALAKPKKEIPRQKVLVKRWAGIGGGQ